MHEHFFTMKQPTIFFTLLLLLMWITCAMAHETSPAPGFVIKGKVTDERGNPLAGARVAVLGTTTKNGTNAKGQFQVLVSENRTYTLSVSFVGYRTVNVEASPDMQSEVSVQLEPSKTNLDEVVVTGTRSERPLKDVPVLTRIISRKEIETINPIDFVTLLQTALPGLQFSYSNMSQAIQITYQGMDSKAVLFLLDGERVSGEGGANNIDYNRFNVNDIDHIEVVRGAAATLYDSRAIGGVINIITRKSLRPVTAHADMRYAGRNGQMYSASVGVNQKKFSSLTTFGFRRRSTYDIFDPESKLVEKRDSNGTIQRDTLTVGETTIYGYRTIDIGQKLSYTFNDKLRLDLRGAYYANTRPTEYNSKFHQTYTDLTLNARLTWLFAKDQSLEMTLARDDYSKVKKYDLVDLREKIYRNVNNSARLYYSGIFGNHTISAGFDFVREALKHYNLPDTATMHLDQYSLSLQEDWRITPRLNVVAGVRADKAKGFNLHFTPKLSLMYRPLDVLTLRAGYSQGYRVPNLKELYQEWTMGGFIKMMGNPNLKPEVGSQISASAEYDHNGLNLSLSAYYNRYRNKISYTYVNPGKSYDMQWANADSVKTFGVEATANYKFAFGLQLTSAYTYITDFDEHEGYNLSWLRPHSAKFGATYSLRLGKTLETLSVFSSWVSRLTNYTYSSKEKSYTREVFPSRTLCSVNLRSQLPRGVTLGLMVDNLFNYRDKAINSTVQLPENGISFVATLSINFADMLKL